MAGTEAEALEEHCLPACSPWLAPPALSYNSEQLARGGALQTGLGSLLLIITEEMAAEACL